MVQRNVGMCCLIWALETSWFGAAHLLHLDGGIDTFLICYLYDSISQYDNIEARIHQHSLPVLFILWIWIKRK